MFSAFYSSVDVDVHVDSPRTLFSHFPVISPLFSLKLNWEPMQGALLGL